MAARTKDAATIGVLAAILTATAITGGKIVLKVNRFRQKKRGQPDLLPPPSSYLSNEKTTSGYGRRRCVRHALRRHLRSCRASPSA